MKRFIFTERNGIYIIDLQQSLAYIDRAYEFVRETVAHGGTVLFRWYQEASPGINCSRSLARWYAVCESPLVRWHADKLPDCFKAYFAHERT